MTMLRTLMMCPRVRGCLVTIPLSYHAQDPDDVSEG